MHNQSGVSLAFVTVTTTVIISSIAYLVITLIPRLRDENKKIKNFVNYRMFVTSLNDYVVHSLREGWCLKSFGSSTEAFKGIDRKVVVSDLLIAEDKCKQGTPMEEIVTYEGNLERLLWNTDVVGTNAPGVSPANTIIGINQYRRETITPKPELLTREKVMVSDFTFRMTDKVLADMSGEHPLYVIAKNVRNCLESVDVKIDLVKDIEGVPVGNERKIKVEVVGKIFSSLKKPSCAGIRQMQSAAFYSFYPRSLNTFSLVKFGDLSGTLFHEYHGPVYVAGDVRLPQASFDRKKSSVFYSSLVLGYKSAKETGKIVDSSGEEYTFKDRGDPILTKQDQYEGFRGFIGGVQLDSKEDRGFYNLFDYTASAGSGVGELEQCIAESKIFTNPSYTAGSVLAYRTDENRDDMAMFKLGFTRKNRFRPAIFAPSVIAQPDEDYRFFKFKVLPEPMNDDLQSLSEVQIRDGRGREYSAYMGAGSSIRMELDLEKMRMRASDIQALMTNVQNANRDTWPSAIPEDHILYNLDERKEFSKRADDLADECDDEASKDCEVLGYSVNCDKGPLGLKCNYNVEEFRYKKAKEELLEKLEDIRDVAGAPGEPTFTAELTDVPKIADPFTGEMKTVLNIKNLTLRVSPKWRTMIRYYMTEFFFTLTPDHYSTSSKLRFAARLNTFDDLADNYWKSTRWKNSFNGDDLDFNRLNPDLPRDEIIKLDCPEGIGMADWDLDMSSSANFSWNYANTPAGTQVDNVSHESLPEVIFTQTGSQREGHAASTSKSIVRDCIVPIDRTHIYGFYVCERLVISPGRSAPLHMIGTFIVKDLVNTNTTVPVYWHTVWDSKIAHLILTDLKNGCGGLNVNISWKDLMSTPAKEAAIKNCGALDLVSNGPNNFMWTTVDPEIGLANPGDVMTSQKVKRVQRWLIKEDSRSDIVR